MKILKEYKYGSQVYQYKQALDLDFIFVVDYTVSEQIETVILGQNEIHYYPKSIFLEKLNNHDISMLECVYQESESTWNFKLDKEKLRRAISEKSSNSFVKAKKKLLVEKDYCLTTAQKSLFHSLRILHFGIQIAKYEKIIDFQEANHYWEKIKTFSSWADMEQEFKPIYNKLKSDFRLACPKIA